MLREAEAERGLGVGTNARIGPDGHHLAGAVDSQAKRRMKSDDFAGPVQWAHERERQNANQAQAGERLHNASEERARWIKLRRWLGRSGYNVS